MKLLVFMCCWLLAVAAKGQQVAAPMPIIPAPLHVEYGKGQFIVTDKTYIGYTSKDDHSIALLFQDYLKVRYGKVLELKQSNTAGRAIIFTSAIKNHAANNESYQIDVQSGNIRISGADAGLFYGMQSLMQLISQNSGQQLVIPEISIKDQPRYKYRGFLLDVGRHMFPVSFIKQCLDYMAKYKLNNFQWHLTDDQGWRIEIKKYPQLHKVGAYRAQTLIGREKSGKGYDGMPYGGYYTQQEIKEVVAYAAARYINVIPEIEMPGHALAALAAYPNLGCGNKSGRYQVAQDWGIFDDVFCAGKEDTFDFLKDVLDEVISLFPSKYIHIGGDECNKKVWKSCSFCQKRIKDEKLKDEHQLQSYFIQRMEKYINGKGRKIIGWDEILEGGLAPNATLMSWRGAGGGIEAANQNHDVIMTANNGGLYFDYSQGPDKQREPLSIGGLSTLETIYHYNPTPAELDIDKAKHIIGVQANMWTEYIPTTEKLNFMLYPRLFALSEIAWTGLAQKNWKNFSTQRLPLHLEQLEQNNLKFRVPEVIGIKDTIIYAAAYTVKNLYPSVSGGKIYYTLDNQDPRDIDHLYQQEVQIKVPPGEQRIFKAITITPKGRASNYITVIVINSASPAK